ncbi:hypothetical protein [Nesterenkonia sp. NBAIMH1]|uniref:ABC transporter permease subunit n=1 Tax=Nesterenkonia sp. NBAIMH1 TaxID=2600320 RepID=UPI001FEDBDFA|nr:hypothetical protein [Nesterenkonia sp. NBAIMH1]
MMVVFSLSVLTLFGFYALLAWGLGLIFGQLGVVNVAHGEFAMVGAFTVVALAPLPFVIRVLVAILVAIVLAVLAERYCSRSSMPVDCWPLCWRCGASVSFFGKEPRRSSAPRLDQSQLPSPAV